MKALRVTELAKLTPLDFDVLLSPYGSSFPKQAWRHLLDYLDASGTWVNVGGVTHPHPA